MTRLAGAVLAIACLAVAGCNQSAAQQQSDSTMTRLADHIAIQDLLNRYYEHFGGGSNQAFGDYYTDDGVMEVNGARYQGHDAIVKLYDTLGSETAPAAGPQTVFHMVLSNPVIDINGDTATAKLLWTGVDNPADVSQPPHLREQGREYDQLVKQDGRWLIKHRVVIADSGLPASMRATYQRQPDFAFPAEGPATPGAAPSASATP